MKTKFLTLNKPCHEKWENMTPNERGSFCDSCSKNVIDFTRLSQLEISETMKGSDGNICARVSKTQLNTPIFNLEPEKKNFNFPYSKVAAGLMFASSLTVVHPVSANMPIVQTEAVQSIASNMESEEEFTELKPKTSASNDVTVFSGKVVSESSNSPVDNAKITLFTANRIISTHTSEDGTFSLEIPNQLIDEANVIRASYREGRLNRFEERDYILTKEEIKKEYLITAELVEFYNGGMGEQRRYNPIAIYNGEEIDYEEFVDAYEGKKNSCNLENKEFFYFAPKAAVAIYGEDGEYGLYILTEKPVK